MKKSSVLRFLVLLVMISVSTSRCGPMAQAQTSGAANLSRVAMLQGRSSSITTQVLFAESGWLGYGTTNHLSFRIHPREHPSRIAPGDQRKVTGSSRSDSQPTVSRTTRRNALDRACDWKSTGKNLLIIGLGDSRTLTPQRMKLVGSIAYRESSLRGIVHPYFAPTILNGGVARHATTEASEKFMIVFERAARKEKLLQVWALPEESSFKIQPTSLARQTPQTASKEFKERSPIVASSRPLNFQTTCCTIGARTAG